mmetsp:Transcript_119217/g.344850  ORF Transcript_119217/g.344850 Transcript_119217/m.344850 type:complete len:214 (+) Transcript_119217:151-792(+)
MRADRLAISCITRMPYSNSTRDSADASRRHSATLLPPALWKMRTSPSFSSPVMLPMTPDGNGSLPSSAKVYTSVMSPKPMFTVEDFETRLSTGGSPAKVSFAGSRCKNGSSVSSRNKVSFRPVTSVRLNKAMRCFPVGNSGSSAPDTPAARMEATSPEETMGPASASDKASGISVNLSTVSPFAVSVQQHAEFLAPIPPATWVTADVANGCDA